MSSNNLVSDADRYEQAAANAPEFISSHDSGYYYPQKVDNVGAIDSGKIFVPAPGPQYSDDPIAIEAESTKFTPMGAHDGTPQFIGDNGAIVVGSEDILRQKNENTICGMRRKIFYLVVLALLIVVAVAGVVAGVVISRSNKTRLLEDMLRMM